MKEKVISIEEAVDLIKPGMTVMVGSFLGVGGPNKVLDAISEREDIKDLTIIANDTAFPEVGLGKLIVNKQVKKLIASHIGTNRETGRQMSEGELEVILQPQGTIAEQIRAGAAGLGGVLTPVGIGTTVEEGKEKIEVDGKEYLLEKPLKADIAIISGYKTDKMGNIQYRGTTRTYSTYMAPAADITIVQTEEVVEVGEIDPNHVVTPGIFVDYIVEGGAQE